MNNTSLHRFIFIIFLFILVAVFSTPPSYLAKVLGKDNSIVQKLEDFKVTLGLDLAGGTELDYKIDLTEAIAQNTDSDPANDVNINTISESVRDSLEARVNPAGIGEIIVKRSQINGEEHVLIQMPPSSNVAKAKSMAEKNNRLEFFAESPEQVKLARVKIAKLMTLELNNGNWDTKTKEILADDNQAHLKKVDKIFADQIQDKELAKDLKTSQKGEIINKIISTTVMPTYSVGADGQINISGDKFFGKAIAIIKVTDIIEEEREVKTEKSANARHILFAYPEAAQAKKDLPYKNKEEAKAKAEEILQKIKDGGDFAALAKEFSNGPSGAKGGDLGNFTPGQMASAFNDAVFNKKESGLVPEIIETDFGFHIIEVTKLNQAEVEKKMDKGYVYEMLFWGEDDLTWVPTKLGGKQLDIARVGFNKASQPLVDLRFDAEGGKLFANITGRLASRKCGENNEPCRLGIKVGGNWISKPTVQQKITGRNAQITGSFTQESAKNLADGLNLGAIDAPVILSGQTTIQAELGKDQLDKSIKAAALGLLATIVFMIIMYQLAGLVAAISLLLYTGMFITILKIWPVSLGGPIVLSLAGAAGIALSIGLAVDGNILIFERVKEEIKKGRGLLTAVDLGFERAWSAIKDSNLTTLLTCIILFSFGSSIVKGFAITLIVGTLLSMFTAVTISRNLLRIVLQIPGLDNPKFLGVNPKDIGKKGSKLKIRKRK